MKTEIKYYCDTCNRMFTDEKECKMHERECGKAKAKIVRIVLSAAGYIQLQVVDVRLSDKSLIGKEETESAGMGNVTIRFYCRPEDEREYVVKALKKAREVSDRILDRIEKEKKKYGITWTEAGL